jgi:hypothetical protein
MLEGAEMKGLSLQQPWASLISIDAKRIETRSWNTYYRGPIAIHASKTFRETRSLCFQGPFYSVLHVAGLVDIVRPGVLGVERLPCGAIVAVAELKHVGCIRHDRQGVYVGGNYRDGPHVDVSASELLFGNFTPGRFGWVLDKIVRLREPISCRGSLGLWDVPADVAAKIKEQLG